MNLKPVTIALVIAVIFLSSCKTLDPDRESEANVIKLVPTILHCEVHHEDGKLHPHIILHDKVHHEVGKVHPHTLLHDEVHHEDGKLHPDAKGKGHGHGHEQPRF